MIVELHKLTGVFNYTSAYITLTLLECFQKFPYPYITQNARETVFFLIWFCFVLFFFVFFFFSFMKNNQYITITI